VRTAGPDARTVPTMSSSTPDVPNLVAARAAVAGMLLFVVACVPIPGGGWDAEQPGPDDGSGAPAATASIPDLDDRAECTDPRTGPVGAPALPMVRPDGSRPGPEVPTALLIDPPVGTDVSLVGPSGQDGAGPAAESACVPRVVLAALEDPASRALAGARAVIEGVPLVIARAVTDDTEGVFIRRLRQLGVDGIVSYGPLPGWASAAVLDARDLIGAGDDPLTLAVELARDAGVLHGATPGHSLRIVLLAAADGSSQADVVAAAAGGSIPLVLPEDPGLAARLVDDVRANDLAMPVSWAASSLEHERTLLASAGVEGLPRWTHPAGAARTAELWLGDVRDPDGALLAAVTAAARGAAFVAVDGSDLRSGAGRTDRMRRAFGHPDGPATVLFVGEATEHTGWQLDTVLTGSPLPGGGFLPLEDRRIVALYGSPDAPSLGLLGEQDDAVTIDRTREFARRYEDAADGRIVVPGLDIITTIASSSAEATGDYSRRVPVERLRGLVGLAGEAGMAVFLDLQPGRSSFLDQAQEYEALLREPHVHLALDPEWRLGPRERHLVRIGSVAAEEVQQVADWLADLVRRERLPQKVLMLHQFTFDMLPDRDAIVVPVELVGVIHVDGQGRLATKDRTYAALSGGAGERWEWGWKNFTRIDRPVATPEQSLDRVPIPVVVTYQ
jgi:hypothetical protein